MTRSIATVVRVATLLLFILPAVSSCETRPGEWRKPGASDRDLRRDLADCERVGTGLGPFHFWALHMTYEEARDRIVRLKDECMAARGWNRSLPRG